MKTLREMSETTSIAHERKGGEEDAGASGTAGPRRASYLLWSGMAAYGHTTMRLTAQLYSGIAVMAGIILVIGIVHRDPAVGALAIVASATMTVMTCVFMAIDILTDRRATAALKEEIERR